MVNASDTLSKGNYMDNSIKLTDEQRERMSKILDENFSKEQIVNLFKHFPEWEKIIKEDN